MNRPEKVIMCKYVASERRWEVEFPTVDPVSAQDPVNNREFNLLTRQLRHEFHLYMRQLSIIRHQAARSAAPDDVSEPVLAV